LRQGLERVDLSVMAQLNFEKLPEITSHLVAISEVEPAVLRETYMQTYPMVMRPGGRQDRIASISYAHTDVQEKMAPVVDDIFDINQLLGSAPVRGAIFASSACRYQEWQRDQVDIGLGALVRLSERGTPDLPRRPLQRVGRFIMGFTGYAAITMAKIGPIGRFDGTVHPLVHMGPPLRKSIGTPTAHIRAHQNDYVALLPFIPLWPQRKWITERLA
jgi:hypothetical protein